MRQKIGKVYFRSNLSDCVQNFINSVMYVTSLLEQSDIKRQMQVYGVNQFKVLIFQEFHSEKHMFFVEFGLTVQ